MLTIEYIKQKEKKRGTKLTQEKGLKQCVTSVSPSSFSTIPQSICSQISTMKFEQRSIISDDQLRPTVFSCTPVLHHPSTLWVRFDICFESEPTLGTPCDISRRFKHAFLSRVYCMMWCCNNDLGTKKSCSFLCGSVIK